MSKLQRSLSSKSNTDANNQIKKPTSSKNINQIKLNIGIKSITDKDNLQLSSRTNNSERYLEKITENQIVNEEIYDTSNQNTQNNIKVICRIRPFNQKEKEIGEEGCIEILDNQNIKITVKPDNTNTKQTSSFPFSFDKVFNGSTSQEDFFNQTGLDIIQSLFKGYNGSILAYGQTSSGKSHTMTGIIENTELKGLIPRIVERIFLEIDSNSLLNIEYKVTMSLCEIYQEKIKDLLDTSSNKTNLNIREDKSKGVYIDGLTEEDASSSFDLLNSFQKGIRNRVISSTNMNEQSSRSHLIVIMSLSQFNSDDLSKKTGKLFLVDLAGSEKISKTGAVGQTLEEAKNINKSLTTLGMVINALSEKGNGKISHIPYRDSKLTRILSESLGGNSKTSLIITLSPSTYNDSESLSTLRFGMRAKKVKNNAKVNKDMSIQELKHEIDKLNIQCLKYQWRIEKLEEYMKSKGNQIPSNEDLELEEEERKASKRLNETIKEEENEYLESTLIYNTRTSSMSKPFLAIDRNKEMNECQVYESVVNNKEINEIENIKIKYVEMLYIINQVEEEKEELRFTLKSLQKEMTERKVFVLEKVSSFQIVDGDCYNKSMSNMPMNISNININANDGSGYSKKGLIYVDACSYKNMRQLIKEKEKEKEKANSIDESLKSANRNINKDSIKYEDDGNNDNQYTSITLKLYETIEEILIDIEEMKEKESKIQSQLNDMYEIYKDKSKKLYFEMRKLKEKGNVKANNVDSINEVNKEKSKEEILKDLEEKANRLINSHVKTKPGVSNVIYNKSFITWNLGNFKNRFRNIDANKGCI